MSALALSLIADYGVPILFCVTFLSCLALPVPSSLLMLASGGFAATGDLSLTAVLLAAFIGAVLGDNSGYWLARGLDLRIEGWLARIEARPSFTAAVTNYFTPQDAGHFAHVDEGAPALARKILATA